nr:reverse transcriptase domain-containing protein [Tanacetum cinerariifolium]
MKLNPNKCTFEIEEGTFMGYKVNTEGIMTKNISQRTNLGGFHSGASGRRPSRHTHGSEGGTSDPYTLFMNGSSCVDGSKAGLILTNLEGAESTYALRFRFDATNNEAECEALIAGLKIAEQMGVKNLQTNVDSRLVSNQVNGSYIAKEPGMIQYLEKVKTLSNSFKKFSIKQVPRSENKKANALSKITSTSFAHLTKQVLVEELKEKYINEAEVLTLMFEEGDQGCQDRDHT